MVDILAFGAHPDDIEITMAGSVLAFKRQGYSVGVCDLCAGEAATYGTPEIRRQELRTAAEMLGLDARVTLDLPDGGIRNSEESRMKVIEVIRRLTPEIVFTFDETPGRHPDHHNTGIIVREAVFLAGLEKIKTDQPPFRPSALVRFPELIAWRKPDFVIDITEFWGQKVAAIRAHSSQVTAEAENDANTKTFIRSNRFWDVLEAQNKLAGAMIGARYGEPFYYDRPVRVDDIRTIFTPFQEPTAKPPTTSHREPK